jgi:two-component system chemotaxis sensor kinase CheA
LADLMGSRNRIAQLVERLEHEAGYSLLTDALRKEVRKMGRRILLLQDRITELRMVPVNRLFRQLGREGRRLARELGRQVEFHLGGEGAELDRALVDELTDPLLHLLRNALDHGIEEPEKRVRSGKPPSGNVWLSAWQRGGRFVVEVRDDGRGVDLEAVRRRGKAAGLIRPDEEFSDRQLKRLLFHPGFSTRPKVTELSGRGVGLDVVQDRLAKRGGTVQLESRPGEGCAVVLSVPITLAVVPSLLVEVSGQRFALPLTSVVRAEALLPAQLAEARRLCVLELGAGPVRMAELDRMLQLEPLPDERESYAVIIASAAQEIALVVWELIGREDLVIQHLSPHLGHVPAIAGAADLGREVPVLVLDPAELVTEGWTRHES